MQCFKLEGVVILRDVHVELILYGEHDLNEIKRLNIGNFGVQINHGTIAPGFSSHDVQNACLDSLHLLVTLKRRFSQQSD